MEDIDFEIDGEKTEKQSRSNGRRTDQLAPYQYKKGQSGNPGGKKPGTVSLKTYVKNKLLSMSEDEREEFLNGVDKRTVWEMAEGTANTTHEITLDNKAPLTADELLLKKEYDQRLKEILSKKD